MSINKRRLNADDEMTDVLTKDQRIRRVALLCCHFTRNLAYFRSGWTELKPKEEGAFWITAIGGFIDVAVLEWCKLFGNHGDKHHWKNIVTDRVAFRSELKNRLGIKTADWDKAWASVRTYRNEFIAHLDSALEMHIPDMHLPQRMVEFYFSQLRDLCSNEHVLRDAPIDMDAYYVTCYQQGVAVYQRNKNLEGKLTIRPTGRR